MNGKIYSLTNPITKEVFYIGATSKQLSERLHTHYQHLSEAQNGNRVMNDRLQYLKFILPLKATINLLEECDIKYLDEREIYYIEAFKQNGCKLTNGTIGGKGGATYINFTEERLKEVGDKISLANKGRSKPEGFAENLSKTRTGAGNPAAGKTKYDKVILFIKGSKPHRFNAGYEINAYLGTQNGYSNVLRALKHTNGVSNYRGLLWKFEKSCTKEEIKDIV